MIDQEALKSRFVSLLTNSGVAPDVALDNWDDLRTRYSEGHRAYHALDHVAAMLRHFDTIKDQLDDPDSVEAAIWYHDVVYHTQKTCPDREFHNEQESVDLAREHLKGSSFDLSKIDALIMATIPGNVAKTKDEEFLQDIDLSIFAQDREIYKNYIQQVNIEYGFVPVEQRKVGRLKIMQIFYKKDFIYNTKHFRDLWEKRAKDNLSWEIQSLKSEIMKMKNKTANKL